MIRLHDVLDAIRIGIRAAREHLRMMRYLRSGRCPDHEPTSF